MYCGVDIGASKTIVVREDGEIMLEPTGSPQRPSMLSFVEGQRFIGEGAIPHTLNANTIKLLPFLLGKNNAAVMDSDVSAYFQLPWAESDDASSGMARVSMADGAYTTTEVYGMYLAQLRGVIPADGKLVFTIPVGADATYRRAIYEACTIAGMEEAELKAVQFVPSDQALVHTLERKMAALFAKSKGDENEVEHSLVLDMGALQTTAIVVKRTGKTVEKLSSRQDTDLGAIHFDVRIFKHLIGGAAEPAPGSKRGKRLMAGGERLRKLLSQIREASVTVENLTDMGDKTFKMSRNDLTTASADLLARVEALISDALQDCGVATSEIKGVELVGGGSRMVVVQEATVLKMFGKDMPLHAKLDDTSGCVGAALIAADRRGEGEETSVRSEEGSLGLSDEALAAAVAGEIALQKRDADARALVDARNALEESIYKWRGASDRKHAELIDTSLLSSALDGAETWLWDHMDAALADVEAQRTQLQAVIDTATKAFVEAEAADVAKLDAELQAAADKEAAERAANGEEDDHDTRKLPKKERMRMVMKNKEEGTELFKGKNWRMAGARYSKALSHCGKMFDLSPEDKTEVDAVKVSLYNNLALCYTKMENWDAVLRNANDALNIDEKNAKALFRRASAHEVKKDWDAALKDLKTAGDINPDDGSIPAMTRRIRKAQEKEKEKERKMYGNIFGK